MIDRIRDKRTLTYALASVIAIAHVSPAMAQQQAGGAQADIVVTAQKKRETIQDVPGAVSAVSGQSLDRLHITQLAALNGYIPSLQVISAGAPGQSAIAIRGISPLGSAGGSPVATYIDETPVGGSNGYAGANNFALDLLPYDLERIEVLRGPQGTLYGANALGGLLKYALTTPNLDKTEIRAGGDLFGINGAGSVGGGFRANYNGDLVPDKLGVIASYGYENTPGYIDNFQTGRNNINGSRQQSARLSLLWQPAENVAVHLNALYQGIRSDGNATVALDPDTLHPIAGSLGDNVYTDQPFRKDLYYFSATINADFGWADLTSASAFSRTNSRQVLDQSRQYGTLFPFYGEPSGVTDYIWTLHQKKVTQEIRLTSPKESKFEWLIGGFFDYEDTYNLQEQTADDFKLNPITSINPIGYQLIPTVYKEYAGFANVGYTFWSRLKIQAGVRFAHNQQNFKNISTGVFYGISNVKSTSGESVWTYRVGPELRLTKNLMFYGTVSSGYQPGGPNFAPSSVAGPYKSSRITNYEAGVKAQTSDHRARLELAAFDIDWTDIQLLAFTGLGQAYYANGGKARSRGVEAEGSLNLLKGLNLSGNISYTEATLRKDVPSVGGVVGDRLPYTPKVGASAQIDYGFDIAPETSMHLNAGYRYQGVRYSAVNHSSIAYPLKSYQLVDLNGELTHGAYTVRLFVKNVTDRRAYNSFTVLTNAATSHNDEIEATVVQPRTVGMAVDLRF